MAYRSWCFVALCLISSSPSWSKSVPNASACTAALPGTGQEVIAREHLGQSSFAAYASYDSDGWPSITYSQAYFAMPGTLQHFLSLHECGHLVLHTTNEFRANCYAIAHGNWSAADMALIARSHLALGRIPPQYGGSGQAFWENTQRTCPGLFR